MTEEEKQREGKGRDRPRSWDLRSASANLMPHCEHFETDSSSLLFLATIDLEFIYFHLPTAKLFKNRRIEGIL